MHVISRSLIALSTVAAISQLADAHVSMVTGPSAANKSTILTFGIGHGCEDSVDAHVDTLKVRVDIPAGVTGVRGLYSDFGKPTLIKTGELVTAVEWSKPAADAIPDDGGYYEVKIRAKLPDAPFSKLKFVVTQTCQDSATNLPITAVWDQDEGSTTGNPAPVLTVVPARTNGWQKFTVPRAITQDEMPAYFGDAAIVWKGTAAYSSNAQTAAMISTTAGVSALSGGLAANDEVWVKY
jgi:uncharacterized protein YcnI